MSLTIREQWGGQDGGEGIYEKCWTKVKRWLDIGHAGLITGLNYS